MVAQSLKPLMGMPSESLWESWKLLRDIFEIPQEICEAPLRKPLKFLREIYAILKESHETP